MPMTCLLCSSDVTVRTVRVTEHVSRAAWHGMNDGFELERANSSMNNEWKFWISHDRSSLKPAHSDLHPIAQCITELLSVD